MALVVNGGDGRSYSDRRFVRGGGARSARSRSKPCRLALPFGGQRGFRPSLALRQETLDLRRSGAAPSISGPPSLRTRTRLAHIEAGRRRLARPSLLPPPAQAEVCNEKEEYEAFWENYDNLLKLSCMEDKEEHKRIATLVWFFYSQGKEELISLDEYVESMKPEQKAIYFIAG